MLIDKRLTNYLKWWAGILGLVYDEAGGFLSKDVSSPSGPLFPPEVPRKPDRHSKQFVMITEKFAGVPDVTDYSLRHTAASNFANAAFRAGFDLKEIADHLGCTVATLIKSYLHRLDERDNKERQDRLAEAMRQSHMQKTSMVTIPERGTKPGKGFGKIIRFPGKAVNE